jgi:hypothetical protein
MKKMRVLLWFVVIIVIAFRNPAPVVAQDLTADQVGAALSSFGSAWMSQNGGTGYKVLYKTNSETGQWVDDPQFGRVFRCEAVAAIINTRNPNAAPALIRIPLRVVYDPDRNTVRALSDAGRSDPRDHQSSYATVREEFPLDELFVSQGSYQKLADVSAGYPQRSFQGYTNKDPERTAGFILPGPGYYRITIQEYPYNYNYRAYGGVSWWTNDRQIGSYSVPTFLDKNVAAKGDPQPPVDGRNYLRVYVHRQNQEFPSPVTLKINPLNEHTGWGTEQKAHYQRVTVEYSPYIKAFLNEAQGLGEVPEDLTAPPASSIPASTGWSGQWQTPEFGEISIRINGTTVTGSYPHDRGRITGTISGNVLKGTWSEAPSYAPPNDAGDFEFTMAADGRSFSGRWRYGSSGEWKPWSGAKK